MPPFLVKESIHVKFVAIIQASVSLGWLLPKSVKFSEKFASRLKQSQIVEIGPKRFTEHRLTRSVGLLCIERSLNGCSLQGHRNICYAKNPIISFEIVETSLWTLIWSWMQLMTKCQQTQCCGRRAVHTFNLRLKSSWLGMGARLGKIPHREWHREKNRGRFSNVQTELNTINLHGCARTNKDSRRWKAEIE